MFVHSEDALDLPDKALSKLIRWLHRKVSVLPNEMSSERFSKHLKSLVHVPLSKVINEAHNVAEALGGREENYAAEPPQLIQALHEFFLLLSDFRVINSDHGVLISRLRVDLTSPRQRQGHLLALNLDLLDTCHTRVLKSRGLVIL